MHVLLAVEQGQSVDSFTAYTACAHACQFMSYRRNSRSDLGVAGTAKLDQVR